MGTYDPMPVDGKGVGAGTDNTGSWGPWLRDAVGGLDGRLLVDCFAYNPLLPQWGALGNADHITGGGQDDTTPIQNAIAAAQSAGYMYVPIMAGKTYRHRGLTLNPDPSKAPVELVGFGSVGGSRNAGLGKACLLFDGTTGGGVFGNGDGIRSMVSGQNIPASPIRNLNLRGYGSTGTGAAIHMGPTGANAAKLDSGTELDRVFIQNWVGDGFVHDGDGATNFTVGDGWRADAVGGYMFKIRIGSSGSIKIGQGTYDNNSVPGGVAPMGLMLIDMSALTANGEATLVMPGPNHFETQVDLFETDATGVNPADRCGLIQVQINPAVNRQNLKIQIDGVRNSGWTSLRKSFSFIQVLGGTAAQRRARVMVQGQTWSGFNGDGTASVGHAIPIGNIPVADQAAARTGRSSQGVYPYVDYRPAGDSVLASETPVPYINTPTRAKGTQVIGAAVTSVAGIAHGLAIQPTADDFRFSFTADPLACKQPWASSITSTTFTLNVGTAPGGAGTTVAWWIDNE